MVGVRAILPGSQLEIVALMLMTLYLVAGVLVSSTDGTQDFVVRPDTSSYLTAASHLAERGIISLDGERPTVRREPGYIAFLAAFVGTGLVTAHDAKVRNLMPVILAQVILYGFAALLLAKIAQREFGTPCGVLTLLLVQVLPFVAGYQFQVLSECLTLIFLAGALWCLLGRNRARGAGIYRDLSGAIVFGLLIVTKSAFLFFWPVLVAFLVARKKLGLVAGLAVFLAGVLIPAAWTLRNFDVLGAPVVGSIDGASSLYRGNLVPFQQIPSVGHELFPVEVREKISGMDERQEYQWFKDEALKLIAERPGIYLAQSAARVYEIVVGRPISAMHAIYVALRVLLLALAILGCILLFRQKQSLTVAVILLFAVYNIAIYSLIFATPRYFTPGWFVLSVPISFAIVEITRKHRILGAFANGFGPRSGN